MLKSNYHTTSFGISDVGLVRDHNEDVWAAYPEQGLFLLADGMGGHAAGEVAARESVDLLHALVRKWHPARQSASDEAVAFFRDAMVSVNEAIYAKGESEPYLSGMGTTLCALYFFQDSAVLAHVGDSRIYLLRKKRLEPLTEDHSLVAELMSVGAIRPSEAGSVPYKHILTRAIGTNATVDPTVSYLKAQPEDCFMMCSDGLTNYVSDREIETILNECEELSAAAKKLVAAANAQGGGDNITLVLVKLSHDLPR